MEVLLLGTYATICWIIFKIFKIPVNQWSLTTVVLGGVAIMGTLLGGMAYFHPASQSARSYFVTTPIVPNVKGKITSVPVKANETLKQGDVLFTIDKTVYQGKVDQVLAGLEFARKRLSQTRELAEVAGGSKFDVEKYEKEVADLEAQLVTARFNLESCTVRAPGSGFVTHVRVRPGQMAVSLPLAPVMSFVSTDESYFIAGFSQQPMQTLKVGNEAEVLFEGIPGRVFKAKVTHIYEALAEGELRPGAAMVSFHRDMPAGRIPVRIEFEQDMTDFFIPMGSDAVVAVYSHRWHHVQIIRRVLLRMESWRNFLHFH
ncbi:MAG: biotin/lipoyl-binding protein [Thermodesulfobacteriota bacterium]